MRIMLNLAIRWFHHCSHIEGTHHNARPSNFRTTCFVYYILTFIFTGSDFLLMKSDCKILLAAELLCSGLLLMFYARNSST